MVILMATRQTQRALWQMPFRFFFLAAATYGTIALVNWASFLSLGAGVAVDMVWHIHEMLFGFVVTVIAGFVLTAARTWTQRETATGKLLVSLAILWLVARCSRLLGADFILVAGVLDASIYLIIAAVIARMVFASSNRRNYFFVPIFLLFSVLEGFYTWCIYQAQIQTAIEALLLVFFLAMQVVFIISGRVIPFFTDRGLNRAPRSETRTLTLACLTSNLLFLSAWVTGGDEAIRISALLIALSHFVKWLGWRPWQTLNTPLLWSLHASYLCLIIGFMMIGSDAPRSAAIHCLAIGGFGLMILSMMSRVSLGHTGRKLSPPRLISVAFLFVLIAVVTRVCAAFLPEFYFPLIWTATGAWSLAYILFLYHYTPILLSPRADGKPG